MFQSCVRLNVYAYLNMYVYMESLKARRGEDGTPLEVIATTHRLAIQTSIVGQAQHDRFFDWWLGMICYAMLCYDMLCYAMLCYASWAPAPRWRGLGHAATVEGKYIKISLGFSKKCELLVPTVPCQV